VPSLNQIYQQMQREAASQGRSTATLRGGACGEYFSWIEPDQYAETCRELTRQWGFMLTKCNPQVFANSWDIFGPLPVVYLYRHDVFAQAVSYALAELSGHWAVQHGDVVPKYDATEVTMDAVNSNVKTMVAGHAEFFRLFRQRHVKPCVVSYEQLESNPRRITRNVIRFVFGRDVPMSACSLGQYKKQRNEIVEKSREQWLLTDHAPLLAR